VLAALPDSHRGTGDDLHAWIEKGGEMVIGPTSEPHQPVVRFRFFDTNVD
jgi:hypothetical protein